MACEIEGKRKTAVFLMSREEFQKEGGYVSWDSVRAWKPTQTNTNRLIGSIIKQWEVVILAPS